MTYTYAQLEGLWINAGGPKSQAPIAAAIAEAESAGNPAAKNPSGASGLWQILGAPAGVTGNMFDPATNAKMAVAKYKQAGNKFTPWVTFTNGAYRAFLSGKTTPNLNVPGGGGGASTTGSTTGSNPSECAWAIGWGGIPGTSWVADIFGTGGNLGSGQICLMSKSAFRGMVGVAMIGAAGLFLLVPGVVLLATAASEKFGGPVLRAVGPLAALVPGGGAVAASGAAADAAMEQRLGSGPSEESDLPVRGGTVRESGAETRRRRQAAARSRARRAASPGPAATEAETGF